MKYIKLFENFNEDLNIEDAKWIIISHLGEVKEIEIDPKWNAKELIMFKLNKRSTEEQIESCREHLKEEGFFLYTKKKKCVVGIGNSVKEYCINWLNDNYSNMEVVASKDYPGCFLYRFEPNDNILFYRNKFNDFLVRYDKIWLFFIEYFGLEEQEIKEITKEWISETYNLTDVKTDRTVGNILVYSN
jgi:hypothetical protein